MSGLHRGLYEQLVTEGLEEALTALDPKHQAQRANLHPEEAADRKEGERDGNPGIAPRRGKVAFELGGDLVELGHPDDTARPGLAHRRIDREKRQAERVLPPIGQSLRIVRGRRVIRCGEVDRIAPAVEAGTPDAVGETAPGAEEPAPASAAQEEAASSDDEASGGPA